MKLLIAIFIIIIVPVRCIADDHFEAKKVCQNFAFKQLKAPSTSKFESLDTVAAVLSTNKKWKKLKNVWESGGWVDSQNSYGAMLRTEYMCTVQKVSVGNWKLLDMYWFK